MAANLMNDKPDESGPLPESRSAPDPEILRANPRFRAFLLLIAVVAAIGAGFLAWRLDARVRRLQDLAETDPIAFGQQAGGLLRAAAWVVGFGNAVVAAWLWRLGCRIRRSGQSPPPGSRVSRDTPICTGTPAIRRARVVSGLAIAFLLLGLATAACFHRLAAVLFAP